VWRVESGAGPLALRAAARWRTAAELAWVHELTRYAARTMEPPVVVASLAATDGSTFFWWEGCAFALFPLVHGETLDRENEALRRQAAHLLAQVHRELARWPSPPASPAAPVHWPRLPDPPAIVDHDLDAWHAHWSRAVAPGLPAGPVHGDYYRRNLLCRGQQIVGLIDWDDARLDVHLDELAWSVGELATVDGGVRLDRARRCVSRCLRRCRRQRPTWGRRHDRAPHTLANAGTNPTGTGEPHTAF
jgi:Ser/Thr protein kinase RdoA (MazF antagonist)